MKFSVLMGCSWESLQTLQRWSQCSARVAHTMSQQGSLEKSYALRHWLTW